MMSYRKRMKAVFEDRRARLVFFLVASVYLLVYLFLVKNVLVSGEPLADDAPSLKVVPGWREKVWRQQVAFNYEAVAAFYITRNVAFLLSLNLVFGVVLAFLLGLNLAVVVFMVRRPKVCGKASYGGVLSSLPTLFLGFACCVPTVLLALGSAFASVTLGLIAVRSFFYPFL